MKRVYFSIIILLATLSIFAKQPIMHSNKSNIKMMINGIENEWNIMPELKPDRLELYDETKKVQNVKFISDIDSIEFHVKINTSESFAIVLNEKDTAQVLIHFTNKLPNTLTDEDKIYALSLFWSEAKYNFAFIDRLNFDIDSLYKEYIPKILATKTDYNFYDQMNRFVGTFKDIHTEIHYKNEGSYTDYIPLSARYFGEDLFIIHTRKSMARLYPVGSKILKINGLPTNEYMQKEIEPYINSNYEPSLKMLSVNRLFSSDLSTKKITITYQTPDGQIFTNTPNRNGKTNTDESVGYYPKYWDKPIEIKWEENNIAILAFNTFSYPDRLIPMFESMKDTLYHADGIIIDLRQNRGGATNTGWHLLQYMIKDPYFLNFAWQTRINNGVKRANGNFIDANEDFFKDKAYQTFPADTIYIPDTIKRFDVPMAILISENTCSAAEDFLIILAERKDKPLFIGQPTMGSTGSPLVLQSFPDNGFARICTRRVLYPYSLTPFNEGISPDILVEYTFDEFLNPEYDKDVKVAIEELSRHITKQR